MAREYEKKQIIPPSSIINHEFEMYEDFNGVFMWILDGTGSDWEAYKTPENVQSGIYAAMLKTKATTPAAGDEVSMQKYIDLWNNAKMEISIVFNPINSAGYLDTIFSFPKELGYRNKEVGIRINKTTGQIWILNQDRDWEAISGNYYLTDHVWYILTFSWDNILNKYIQARIGQDIRDLSTKKIYNPGTGLTMESSIKFKSVNDCTWQSIVMIDRFLIKGIT